MVVLGCDLDLDGYAIGDETEMRCREAAKMYRQFRLQGSSVTIVVSPGMADKKKFPDQVDTMAQMMRDFLVWTLGVSQFDILRPEGEGKEKIWGTEQELERGFSERRRLISEWQATNGEPLHVVTGWYHAPRVRMISTMIFNQRIIVHSAEGGIVNALIEIPKIILQHHALRKRLGW